VWGEFYVPILSEPAVKPPAKYLAPCFTRGSYKENNHEI